MTRQEVKEFIQSGAELLQIPFDTGRISEFNSNRTNTYPFVFLETISAQTTLTNSLPTDTYAIKIHVLSKDWIDSSNQEYDSLIDKADVVAQRLIKRYNDILSNYNLVTINSISRVPFIKKHADCLTGVLLSFNLITQDTSGCD
jgi:hypothetical protein